MGVMAKDMTEGKGFEAEYEIPWDAESLPGVILDMPEEEWSVEQIQHRMTEAVNWLNQPEYRGEYWFVLIEDYGWAYSFHFSEPDTAFAFKMRWVGAPLPPHGESA